MTELTYRLANKSIIKPFFEMEVIVFFTGRGGGKNLRYDFFYLLIFTVHLKKTTFLVVGFF